jgi:hypothetical protein
MKQLIAVATLLSLGFAAEQKSLAEVVYDTSRFDVGGMSMGLNPMGQAVRLAGNERQVTRIDLGIGSGATGDFSVRFYELDMVSGTPGNLIWESPGQRYVLAPPYYNAKLISVDVPRITVPDTFIWTVQVPVPVQNMLLMEATLPTSGIGTPLDQWVQTTSPPPLPSGWFKFRFDTLVFAARITAIPEPSSMIMWLMTAIAFPSRWLSSHR